MRVGAVLSHRLDRLLRRVDAPKNGTGTGAPWNERTMPAISGQYGARISTSSPGLDDRAGDRAQRAGGAGGDQHVLGLASRSSGAPRVALDDRVDQRRQALRRARSGAVPGCSATRRSSMRQPAAGSIQVSPTWSG